VETSERFSKVCFKFLVLTQLSLSKVRHLPSFPLSLKGLAAFSEYLPRCVHWQDNSPFLAESILTLQMIETFANLIEKKVGNSKIGEEIPHCMYPSAHCFFFKQCLVESTLCHKPQMCLLHFSYKIISYLRVEKTFTLLISARMSDE
jgi:hypothetical protein